MRCELGICAVGEPQHIKDQHLAIGKKYEGEEDAKDLVKKLADDCYETYVRRVEEKPPKYDPIGVTEAEVQEMVSKEMLLEAN